MPNHSSSKLTRVRSAPPNVSITRMQQDTLTQRYAASVVRSQGALIRKEVPLGTRKHTTHRARGRYDLKHRRAAPIRG